MHLGVIPDGNRRYATENSISNKEAYRRAKEVIKDIGEDLKSRKDIEEVTFYLLSEENLKRDDEELETLFGLLEEYIEDVSSSYHKNGFELNWATTAPGHLPEHLRQKLESLEEKFDSGKRVLNLLISYSGKKDILNAAQSISGNGEEFNPGSMKEHLEISSDIDFVIRTGDNPTRECLSGFPIWNASYSEFYHLEKNFPDLSIDDVKEALEHFRELRRKKGE